MCTKLDKSRIVKLACYLVFSLIMFLFGALNSATNIVVLIGGCVLLAFGAGWAYYIHDEQKIEQLEAETQGFSNALAKKYCKVLAKEGVTSLNSDLRKQTALAYAKAHPEFCLPDIESKYEDMFRIGQSSKPDIDGEKVRAMLVVAQRRKSLLSKVGNPLGKPLSEIEAMIGKARTTTPTKLKGKECLSMTWTDRPDNLVLLFRNDQCVDIQKKGDSGSQIARLFRTMGLALLILALTGSVLHATVGSNALFTPPAPKKTYEFCIRCNNYLYGNQQYNPYCSSCESEMKNDASLFSEVFGWD